MANIVSKFVDPANTYSDYTSDTVVCNHNVNSNAVQGVFQAAITSGSIEVQGRLSEEAGWYTITTYTESTMEAVILPYEMRVVVVGTAKAFLGEVA